MQAMETSDDELIELLTCHRPDPWLVMECGRCLCAKDDEICISYACMKVHGVLDVASVLFLVPRHLWHPMPGKLMLLGG